MHGDRVFCSAHPLVRHKVTLLRDVATEPKRFRELVRELSLLLAYEATHDLELREVSVTTPLATARGYCLGEKIGLVPILRAGLGMVDGMWELLPRAEVWHIGLYRDDETLQPVQYYNKLPISPTVQVCMILDPMLATGGSRLSPQPTFSELGGRDASNSSASSQPRRAYRHCVGHIPISTFMWPLSMSA